MTVKNGYIADARDVVGQVYNAMAYGATGDGVTDDTAAIQLAIDTCNAAGGGTVYIPTGTYLLTLAAHPVSGTYLVGLRIYGNIRLVGSGRGATVLKLADAQDLGYVVMNHYIGTYADYRIGIAHLTIDGNADNQTADRHMGIYLLRALDIVVDDVEIKNVRGTATSGTGEGFFFNDGLCTDILYSNCYAIADAGSTSSGFSSNLSQNIHYQNCVARGMTVCNGFTHNACRQIQYTNCHAYLNAEVQFNSEMSEQVSYQGCIAGGRSVDAVTQYAANTDLGGAIGFSIMQGEGVAIGGCISEYSAIGINVQPDSTGVVIGDCVIANNTWGIQVQPAGVPYVRIKNILFKLNGGDITVTGGLGAITTFDAVLPTPAIPASTVALVNPFPFDVSIVIRSGTVTEITLNATALGITAGTVTLPIGQSIILTYSGAPTWFWIHA